MSDNSRGKKDCQIGNRQYRRLGKRGRNGRGPQENRGVGPKEIFKVKKSIWESRVRKDANQENLGSCYRSQRDV